MTVRVAPEMSAIRPFIACLEVRIEPLSGDQVKELMQFQEGLHWALCRDRKKASIGIYDASRLNPSIDYRPVTPDGFSFVALGMPDRALTPAEILTQHPKGADYRHLLDGKAEYPLSIDSNGTVLSMPPIINSEDTKLVAGSHHLFVDVTGLEPTTPEQTIAIIAATLQDMGGRLFDVEIRGSEGNFRTPHIEPQKIEIDVDAALAWTGLDIDFDETARIMERMGYDARRSDRGSLRLAAPRYRVDLRHPVDLYEDLAIGFGYHKIAIKEPPTYTEAAQHPLEVLANLARQTMIGLGFLEVFNITLQNIEDETFKGLDSTPVSRVEIENPASSEQTLVRSHLIGGFLRILSANRRKEPPIRIFEIGDCLEIDRSEKKIRENRKLAVLLSAHKAGFADIRSVADAVIGELGLEVQFQAFERPLFLAGRAALMIGAGGEAIGVLGEVHPQILEAYGIRLPSVLMELTLASDLPGEAILPKT